MIEQKVELLKKQLDKLTTKSFNLDLWKSATATILDSIFGDNNSKSQKIKELNYDFSSWTLRDTASAADGVDKYRHQAMGILEAAIDELESLGVQEQTIANVEPFDISLLISPIEDQLTGLQMRELKKIVHAEISNDIKRKELTELLKILNDTTVLQILVSILLHPQVTKKLHD